jgi:hypothetical protein
MEKLKRWILKDDIHQRMSTNDLVLILNGIDSGSIALNGSGFFSVTFAFLGSVSYLQFHNEHL